MWRSAEDISAVQLAAARRGVRHRIGASRMKLHRPVRRDGIRGIERVSGRHGPHRRVGVSFQGVAFMFTEPIPRQTER